MVVQSPAQSQVNPAWKILIIDDDEEDYLIARDMLKEAKGRKFETHWANTFAAGQAALVEDHFHAVLVDYDLGAHSGVDLIREANQRGYAAPLILFTGRGNYEVDVEAMAAGATMYLTKGEVNPLLLERAIRYAIEMKHKEQSLRESEAALRQSEAKERAKVAELNAMMDAVPAIVWITHDPQAQVVTGNQLGHDLLGLRPGQNLSKSAPDDAPRHFKVFQAGRELAPDELPLQVTAATGQPLRNFEEEIVFEDGERVDLLGNVTPLLDDDGRPCGAVGAFLNITERIQAEQALAQKEAQLSEAQRIAHIGSWYYDLATNTAGGSDELMRIFGLDPAAPAPPLAAQNGLLYPPEAWERLNEAIQTALAAGTGYELDLPAFRQMPGGGADPIWITARGEAARDASGQIVGLRGTVQDITERVRGEAGLKKAEERFTRAFYASPAALAITRAADGRYIEANATYCQLTGYTREQLLGHTAHELALYADYGQRAKLISLLQAQGTVRNYEVGLRTRSGSIRALIGSFDTLEFDNEPCLLATLIDITERQQAEEALRQTHQKAVWMARLPDENPNPVARVSAGGVVLYHNAAAARPGWDLAVGQPVSGPFLRLVEQALAGEASAGEDVRLAGRDYAITVVPIRGEAYANIYGADITERKQAEQALRASELRLTEFLESTHDSFFILNKEWRVLFINPHAAGLLNREPGDLLGKVFWDEFPAYVGTQVETYYRQVMTERVPVHFKHGGLYTHFYFELSVYPTGDGIAVVATDRTAETSAQRALEAAYARLRFFVDANMVGVSLYQDDGTLLEVNDYYLNLVGYTRAEFEAGLLNWKTITPPDRLSQDEAAIATLGEGGITPTYEKRYHRRDGAQVWANISRTRLPDGTLAALVFDITAHKQAEQALRESNAALQAALAQAEEGRLLLETIMEHVPEGIGITGGPPDFAIKRVSRYGMKITRNPTDPDLLGKPAGEHQQVWGVYLPDGQTHPTPEQMPLYRAAHFGETVENVELIIHRSDGVQMPILVNAAPIRGSQGQITGAINTWRDITERKQAEEALRQYSEELQKSEDKFAKSFRSSPVAIAISTVADGRFIEVNDSYTALFGFSKAELIGHTSTGLGMFPDPVARGDIVRRFQADNGFRDYELRLLTKTGQPRDVLFSTERIEVAGQDCMLSLVVDITERKRVENDLHAYMEKLSRSNQELEQFAFIASHDLQEPLRKIILFGNSLRVHLAAGADATTDDYLKRMQAAAERMQAMVRGLLELSRVNSKGGQITRVDLNPVAADVVSDLEGPIRAAKGQVQIGPLPAVEADELQMHQLFQNLIGNAVKFQKPGVAPIVQISGRVDETQSPPVVEIQFQDNGIGFEPQYAERIFQPFQRLHSRTDYEGTGLGLAICRKIVERHQGSITVQSTLGEGSRFIVRLPVKMR